MNRLLVTTLVVGMVASAAYAQPGQRQGQFSPGQGPGGQAPGIQGRGGQGPGGQARGGQARGGQGPGGQARGGQAGGRGGPGGGGGGGSRPGSAGSSTLERTGLKIGQKVPDITIHDDKGGSFPMSGVKGKYTVINLRVSYLTAFRQKCPQFGGSLP